MAQVTQGASSVHNERREITEEVSRLDPARGGIAIAIGSVLLLANLLWVLSLISTVFAGDGAHGLLALLGVPAVFCIVGVVLIDFGIGRLRGSVTSLDRRAGS